MYGDGIASARQAKGTLVSIVVFTEAGCTEMVGGTTGRGGREGEGGMRDGRGGMVRDAGGGMAREAW